MEILVTHAVEPDAWRAHNTANIPAGEAMAGWGNAAHNAARRSRQNVQPRPHTNLPCRAVTEREKNQLINELFIKDQQLQQANTTSAELRGEIVQAKRNATRRHVQSKRGAIGLTKIGHGQPDHGPGNHQSKAKQELKNIRQQIADEKSSAQPCNCDYDQLLNNIVHERVDVNRHRLLSTAKTMSHAAATSTHRHTTTEPQTGHDFGPTSHCFSIKPRASSPPSPSPHPSPCLRQKLWMNSSRLRPQHGPNHNLNPSSAPNIVTRG